MESRSRTGWGVSSHPGRDRGREKDQTQDSFKRQSHRTAESVLVRGAGESLEIGSK